MKAKFLNPFLRTLTTLITHACECVIKNMKNYNCNFRVQILKDWPHDRVTCLDFPTNVRSVATFMYTVNF